MSKDFQIHVPVEIYKSEGENGEDLWKIGGIASTDDVDLQGEEVIQEGLDISILKEGRGLFNNDHKAGPENVLGEIEEADFVDHNGKKALMVKGYLFKEQERAKAYYNIMRSVKKGRTPRVHFSIEGKIEERDMTNTARIKKARVSKVALTLDPVNPCTFANLVKSIQKDNKKAEQDFFFQEVMGYFKSIIEEQVSKAISAGAGYSQAPASRTGGAAMSTESLDSKVKKMFWKKLKRNVKTQKSMIKSIIEVTCNQFPDTDYKEVAEMICKSYEHKLKEFIEC